MPTKQVSLGGRPLHGHDRFGEWIVENLEGWYDAPDARDTSSEAVNSHGDIPGRSYYGARTPTVSGILFHKSRGLAVNAFEDLAATATLEDQVFQVVDGNNVRWANARFAGIDYTQVGVGAWRYQLRLRCSDPFKYGERQSVSFPLGSNGQIMHRGSVPAWPVITVTGSAPGGYTLTRGGRDVVITAPLVSGSPHVLDMRTGVLRAGGSRVYGGIDTAQYWQVNPGLNQTVSASGSGTATVRVDVYDTYI